MEILRLLPAGLLALSLPGALLAQDDLSRGEELVSRRELVAAEAAFRKAVASSPRSARAHADLALALILQGKETDEAVAQAHRAIEIEPKNAEFALRYGMALEASGKPGDAAAAFRTAAELRPNDERAAFRLAAAYAESGDDRAIASFDRLLKIDPESVQNRGLFARYLWQSGRPEQGNRVMEETLELFPGEAALHSEFGEQLSIQGRFETAVRHLELARKLGDDRNEVLVQLGSALWNCGRLEDARAKLEEAVAREPEKAPARVELGRILFWSGSAREAIPHLEIAIRLIPDSTALWLLLGRAYEGAGRIENAEECFRKAVSLDGESSIPRITLGHLLAREGKSEEAKREIAIGKELYEGERKIQFERGSRRVELNLARQELDHGRPAEALARFERMPEDSDVLEGRAAALSRLGRHAEAIRFLERACALDPENKTARARLSQEYQKAGQLR